MSVRATVTLASSGRPITFGTIKAATIAMITSTTIISINVTPLWESRFRGLGEWPDFVSDMDIQMVPLRAQ
jgi:hypothetical protein